MTRVLVRLDEWQHAHAGRKGWIWWLLWRPLCNVVDYRYRREAERAKAAS